MTTTGAHGFDFGGEVVRFSIERTSEAEDGRNFRWL